MSRQEHSTNRNTATELIAADSRLSGSHCRHGRWSILACSLPLSYSPSVLLQHCLVMLLDLQALSTPLSVVLFIFLFPYITLYQLFRRHNSDRSPAATSSTVRPTSFTALPASLLSPHLSATAYEHHLLSTATSRIHYISTSAVPLSGSGSGSSAEDAPLVFVHGFPDWWYVWRKQLGRFAPSRPCIAVDLRGFGYSEVAGDKDAAASYTVAAQCGDIVAILDAHHIGRCFLVGHDWGGMVVWEFARRYPSRLYGVASLCTPYRPKREWRLPLPVLLRLAPHWLYQPYFAFCRLHAARLMQRDIDRFFSLTVRTGRPDDALGSLKFLVALETPATFPFYVRPSSLLSAEERRHVVDMYRWSGFRYPLLWYSTHRLNARQTKRTNSELGLPTSPSHSPSHSPLDGPLPERIDVPALMMVADRDSILQPVLSDGMEAWCSQLTKVTIRSAGHWALLEQPEQVDEALQTWMEEVTKRAR